MHRFLKKTWFTIHKCFIFEIFRTDPPPPPAVGMIPMIQYGMSWLNINLHGNKHSPMAIYQKT